MSFTLSCSFWGEQVVSTVHRRKYDTHFTRTHTQLHMHKITTHSCASLHSTPHTQCHHCISITRRSEDLFLIQSVSAGVTSLALWFSPCLARSLPSSPLASSSLMRLSCHGAGVHGCQVCVFVCACVCGRACEYVCTSSCERNTLSFRLLGWRHFRGVR